MLFLASLLAGPGPKGRLPAMERRHRTRRDLEKQMVGLSRCGEEFKARARLDADGDSSVTSSPRVSWARFFVVYCERQATDARRNSEMAEGLHAAIRFMGRELAAAIGRPEDGDEMADDLELAFLEGRMSVNDAGVEVLVPDDEEPRCTASST